MHEWRKYVRLCIEVDLSKPLLTIFTIKDRKYKIEYEGIHFLCIDYGLFGNYKEGCPEKQVQRVDTTTNEVEISQSKGEQMN